MRVGYHGPQVLAGWADELALHDHQRSRLGDASATRSRESSAEQGRRFQVLRCPALVPFGHGRMWKVWRVRSQRAHMHAVERSRSLLLVRVHGGLGRGRHGLLLDLHASDLGIERRSSGACLRGLRRDQGREGVRVPTLRQRLRRQRRPYQRGRCSRSCRAEDANGCPVLFSPVTVEWEAGAEPGRGSRGRTPRPSTCVRPGRSPRSRDRPGPRRYRS